MASSETANISHIISDFLVIFSSFMQMASIKVTSVHIIGDLGVNVLGSRGVDLATLNQSVDVEMRLQSDEI
jgi:hypothetical protein